MPHGVFISYSRRDLAAVKAVKEQIESLGFPCWMDLEGIESGSEEFSSHITDAINASTVVLFFLSAASQKSMWSLKELRFAKTKGKKTVLVRINDDAMTDSFLFEFGGADIIDWRVPEQKAKLLRDFSRWMPAPAGPASPNDHETESAPDPPALPPAPAASSATPMPPPLPPPLPKPKPVLANRLSGFLRDSKDRAAAALRGSKERAATVLQSSRERAATVLHSSKERAAAALQSSKERVSRNVAPMVRSLADRLEGVSRERRPPDPPPPET